MSEPKGEVLINRYRANYNIPPETPITEEMILTHWELEKKLRRKLLASTPENRWDVFEKCYLTLYSELAWLNEINIKAHRNNTTSSTSLLFWRLLAGDPPGKIFEVGPGRAELIEYLANCGFECRATEITKERGIKFKPNCPNLTWAITDGIHLEQFEPANYYDIAISNQVIEHMHPDDLLAHFKGIYTILKPGGRYILATPHRCAGPKDISAVFLADSPLGMHLREYHYGELVTLLTDAGFTTLMAPLRLPKVLRSTLRLPPLPSRLYLGYLTLLEKLMATLPTLRQRRQAARFCQALLFTTNIMIIARK